MKLKYLVLLFLTLPMGYNAGAQLLNEHDFKNKIESTILPGIAAAGENDITINIDAGEADLHLQIKAEPEFTQIGGTVTFTIAVNNKGPATSDDIVARVIIPKSYSISNTKVGQGTYDEKTQLWKVGSLGAWKRSVMTVVVTVLNNADLMTTGEIISCSTTDPDSTPGNGIDTNGNGIIVDDKDDEDDADGQDVRISNPEDEMGEKLTDMFGKIGKLGETGQKQPNEKSQTDKPANTNEPPPPDNNIILPESYQFSFQSTLRITSNKGTREIQYLLEPDQKYYAKVQNINNITHHIVVDNTRYVEVYFAEVNGTKRRARKKMDIIAVANETGAFRDSPNTKTISIGTKSILGLECKGYKITSEAGTTELWITNQAPATAFGALFESRAAMANSPFTKNSMIMEMLYTSADNSNNYKMECVVFKPAQRQFILNDYTE